MKRTITREIFIETETIRITRKRSVRKKTAPETKTDVSGGENAFVKNDVRLKHLFDQIL
jgi:hypothetical protein